MNEQREPQSVQEWIDQANRAELADDVGEPPPLPSGWWILPGMLLGALLWVALFFAGLASVLDETPPQVTIEERD